MPRIEGEVCRGLGAADMKGGIAVLLELAKSGEPTSVETTFIFYACEEIDREANELRKLASIRPDLLACDAAILCEPTSCVIEAGCQGSMRLEVSMGGLRAHSARPWKGVNAIHRLGPLVEEVAAYEGRLVLLDGCEYREALQVVGISGGVAGNVVPDTSSMLVNHRFAPDRSTEAAYDEIEKMFAKYFDPR